MLTERNQKVLVTDFSRVQLFPTDASYDGSLNDLYREIVAGGDYNFSDHYRLNGELLRYIEALDVLKYVFTTGLVQNDPAIIDELNRIFDGIYNVPMIGHKKDNSHAYLELAKKIGAHPQQMMFIDDTPANVEAASAAGYHTAAYESNDQIITAIQKWAEDKHD